MRYILMKEIYPPQSTSNVNILNDIIIAAIHLHNAMSLLLPNKLDAYHKLPLTDPIILLLINSDFLHFVCMNDCMALYYLVYLEV